MFDGGKITTEAGLLLVREFDERLGLTGSLGGAVADGRDRRYVTHDVPTLLRQRVYQIAAGYEDANDATSLRHDPALQSVVLRIPAIVITVIAPSRSLGSVIVIGAKRRWSGR